VTLTAAAGGGSTFANWSGDCTGTSTTCNLTMNAARNVTATFNTGGGGPFTLTVAKTGWGGPESSVTSSPAGITCGADCSQSYTSGTSVTLTATPAGGFVFDHWEGDCGGTSTTCNVIMGSDKAVIAAFDDVLAPESKFHHPKHNRTYDYDDPVQEQQMREVHVFPDDFGGSGNDAADGAHVEIALRKKFTDDTCEWWTGASFSAGPCNSHVWNSMTEYGTDAYLYNLPELPASIGTQIRNYRAFCLATDAAGNPETTFETGRNSNQFEIAS
jgi:hypothetical protein